jgi:hypothetical protein
MTDSWAAVRGAWHVGGACLEGGIYPSLTELFLLSIEYDLLSTKECLYHIGVTPALAIDLVLGQLEWRRLRCPPIALQIRQRRLVPESRATVRVNGDDDGDDDGDAGKINRTV